MEQWIQNENNEVKQVGANCLKSQIMSFYYFAKSDVYGLEFIIV